MTTGKPYLLALDQGTSSSRSIVFDRQGRIVSIAQREFRQIFPQPGWVEHDPLEIWASQSGVVHAVLAKAGISGRDIAAAGIANQRETTLLWDRATGVPLANAIVWQDRRTADICDRLRAAGHAPMIAQTKMGATFRAVSRITPTKIPNARNIRPLRSEAVSTSESTIKSSLVRRLGRSLLRNSSSRASPNRNRTSTSFSWRRWPWRWSASTMAS